MDLRVGNVGSAREIGDRRNNLIEIQRQVQFVLVFRRGNHTDLQVVEMGFDFVHMGNQPVPCFNIFHEHCAKLIQRIVGEVHSIDDVLRQRIVLLIAERLNGSAEIPDFRVDFLDHPNKFPELRRGVWLGRIERLDQCNRICIHLVPDRLHRDTPRVLKVIDQTEHADIIRVLFVIPEIRAKVIGTEQELFHIETIQCEFDDPDVLRDCVLQQIFTRREFIPFFLVVVVDRRIEIDLLKEGSHLVNHHLVLSDGIDDLVDILHGIHLQIQLVDELQSSLHIDVEISCHVTKLLDQIDVEVVILFL